jgi:hypothetical protein
MLQTGGAPKPACSGTVHEYPLLPKHREVPTLQGFVEIFPALACTLHATHSCIPSPSRTASDSHAQAVSDKTPSKTSGNTGLSKPGSEARVLPQIQGLGRGPELGCQSGCRARWLGYILLLCRLSFLPFLSTCCWYCGYCSPEPTCQAPLNTHLLSKWLKT